MILIRRKVVRMEDNQHSEYDIVDAVQRVGELYDEAVLQRVNGKNALPLFWSTVEAMYFNEQLVVMLGDADRDYLDTQHKIRETLNEIAPGSETIVQHIIQLTIMAATIFESKNLTSADVDFCRFVARNQSESPTNCKQTVCRIIYQLNKKVVDPFICEKKKDRLGARLLNWFGA